MANPNWHRDFDLNKPLPQNIILHAEQLNRQFRDIQEARKDHPHTPPWLFDRMSRSAILLCEKIGCDPNATHAAPLIDAPSVTVPIHDPEAVSLLRLLSLSDVLYRVRESIVETRRWLPSNGRDPNVTAVKVLGAHQIKIYVGNEEEKTALDSSEEWKEILVENLTRDNVRFGVHLLGVKQTVLAKLQTTDARIKVAAEIYSLNKTRLELLYHDSMITSVEVSSKVTPNPNVVVNFKSPELANEAIKKGILWHGKIFPCQKFLRASTLLQSVVRSRTEVETTHNQQESRKKHQNGKVGPGKIAQRIKDMKDQTVLFSDSDMEDSSTSLSSSEPPDESIKGWESSSSKSDRRLPSPSRVPKSDQAITSVLNDPDTLDTTHTAPRANAARKGSSICNGPAPKELEGPALQNIAMTDRHNQAQSLPSTIGESQDGLTDTQRAELSGESLIAANGSPPHSPVLPPLIVRFRRAA
ncbi:MAG: hypothetical protein Q9220_002474 [cf. Caloplaca sp. 1 TL-2023]